VYSGLLKEFDANGDGEIDRREFKDMMMRLLGEGELITDKKK